MHHRPIAYLRLLGLLFATTCVCMAVVLVLMAHNTTRTIRETIAARPLDTEVDLSQPIKYVFPLKYDRYSARGLGLFLEVEQSDPNHRVDLSELDGRILVRNDDNEIVLESLLGVGDYREIKGFKIGEIRHIERYQTYSVMIEITSPRESLAGLTQHLYARYQMCGCEMLPVLAYTIAAVPFGILGLICLTCTLPWLIRHGIRKV